MTGKWVNFQFPISRKVGQFSIAVDTVRPNTGIEPAGFFASVTNSVADWFSSSEGFVQNDPVNFIDPWGFEISSPGFSYPFYNYRGNNSFTWVNPFTYWGDFFGGTGELYRNYRDMRDANTINADKYFHCMGHCQAARRGLGGRNASESIGEGRELLDEYIFNPLKGLPKDKNVKDCNADRDANRRGRNGDPKMHCKDICSPLRPKGLNQKY